MEKISQKLVNSSCFFYDSLITYKSILKVREGNNCHYYLTSVEVVEKKSVKTETMLYLKKKI